MNRFSIFLAKNAITFINFLCRQLIPHGEYCYTIKKHKTKCCPFWELRKDRFYQQNGYCNYLQEGDWEAINHHSLLWDQVKECGINIDGE
jgi:hypothetical protein